MVLCSWVDLVPWFSSWKHWASIMFLFLTDWVSNFALTIIALFAVDGRMRFFIDDIWVRIKMKEIIVYWNYNQNSKTFSLYRRPSYLFYLVWKIIIIIIHINKIALLCIIYTNILQTTYVHMLFYFASLLKGRSHLIQLDKKNFARREEKIE